MSISVSDTSAKFILSVAKKGKSQAWYASNAEELKELKAIIPEDVVIFDSFQAIQYLTDGKKGCGQLYLLLVKHGYINLNESSPENGDPDTDDTLNIPVWLP